MDAHVRPELATEGARDRLLLSIKEKSGYGIVELEIVQKLCDLNDQERLEVSIKNVIDYARAMAKFFRELQALNGANAGKVGGA